MCASSLEVFLAVALLPALLSAFGRVEAAFSLFALAFALAPGIVPPAWIVAVEAAPGAWHTWASCRLLSSAEFLPWLRKNRGAPIMTEV